MHISELIELLFASDTYIDRSFLFMFDKKVHALYNFGGYDVVFLYDLRAKKSRANKYEVSFAIQEKLNCSSSSLQSTCLQAK